MSLKIKLGKAEYDALSDELKTLYVADGEGFKLDADYEDVDGLKAKRDEFRTKYEAAQKALKDFEGLDAEAAKAALAKMGEIEDTNLLKKQQFDDLFAKKKGEWDTEKASLADKLAAKTRREAHQQLALKLAAAGVKPSMIEDLATVLTDRHINFAEDGDDVIWKTKDGLETVDLDKYIPGLKESKADYFPPIGGGGGAPGSNGNGGSATPKTATKAEIAAMSPETKREFYLNDGEPSD